MQTHQILVVDDDKSVVRLMRGYLEKAGYTVLVQPGTGTYLMQMFQPDFSRRRSR